MILYNQHGNAWAEFALGMGPAGQPMTHRMQRRGQSEIEEQIPF